MFKTINTEKDLSPLAQEKVLNALGLEIMDLQDYTDLEIPENHPRYQLYRHGKTFGTISVWGGRYYTRISGNLSGFESVYGAATSWVDSNHLELLESKIQAEIEQERVLLPDYF